VGKKERDEKKKSQFVGCHVTSGNSGGQLYSIPHPVGRIPEIIHTSGEDSEKRG